MSIDPSKPHFTVMLDEIVGDGATLSVTPDGEIICTMHPSAAKDDSPARSSGHTVFRRAVDMVLQPTQRRVDGAT